MKTCLLSLMLVCLAWFGGCKKSPAPVEPPREFINTGGRELTASGVKILVPHEGQSAHTDTLEGITYKSPSLVVTMKKFKLYVNATNYGTLKIGDVVNLLNKDYVFVNDEERQPENQE